MKPLFLEMERFGPYKDKTRIDFKQLPDNLTLISGNTGAGKTTIFDGICCALFGETSGHGRNFTQMNSKLSEDNKPAVVRFAFELKGEVYEVKRSPAFDRKKRNSNEYTRINQKAELILPDGQTINKATSVTQEIKEILGIDMKEFRQIVMIAQNDFMSMIKETERGQQDIFNRIFNADLYEHFAKKISKKKNEEKQQFEMNAEILVHLIEDSGLNKETITGDYIRTEDVLDEIGEKYKIIQERLKEAKESFAKGQEELKRKNEEKAKAEQLLRLFNNRDKAQSQLENLLSQDESINSLEKEKREAERARDIVQNPYENVMRLIAHGENLNRQKNSELEKEKEIATRQETLKEELKSFSESEEKQLYLTYQSLEKELPQYKELNRLIQNEARILKESGELEKEKESIEKSLTQEETKLKSFEILPESDFLLRENNINSKLSEEQQKLNACGELESIIKSLKAQIDNVVTARNKLIESDTEYKEASLNYQKKFNLYISNQASFLAQDLKENEPCPVCGSRHHPKPARPVDETITRDELDRLKKAMDRIEEKYQNSAREYKEDILKYEYELREFTEKQKNRNEEDLEETGKSLEIFLKQAKESDVLASDTVLDCVERFRKSLNKDKIRVKRVIFSLDKEIKDVRKEAGENEKRISEKKKTEERISKLEDKKVKHEKLLVTKKSDIVRLGAAIDSLKGQLSFKSLGEAENAYEQKRKAYNDYKEAFEKIKNRLKESEKESSTVRGAIKSATEQIERNTIETEQAQEVLEKALDKAGFESPEAFLTCLMEPEALERVTKEINNYRSELNSTKVRIRDLNRNLENSATRF